MAPNPQGVPDNRSVRVLPPKPATLLDVPAEGKQPRRVISLADNLKLAEAMKTHFTDIESARMTIPEAAEYLRGVTGIDYLSSSHVAACRNALGLTWKSKSGRRAGDTSKSSVASRRRGQVMLAMIEQMEELISYTLLEPTPAFTQAAQVMRQMMAVEKKD